MGNLLYTDDLRGRIPGVGSNFIINGSMNIWQRGTSFVSPTTAKYSADRWKMDFLGAMASTITRTQTVPTEAQGAASLYSLKVDVTTADTSLGATEYVTLRQPMEGYDYQKLKGKTITISFWVRSNKTGQYSVTVRNSGFDRSYPMTYTIDTADTWEKKSVTVTLDQSGGTESYTNNTGMDVIFCLGSGSTYLGTPDEWASANLLGATGQVNLFDHVDNEFYITAIQLELGSEATEFKYRPIAEELVLCQRYYEKSYLIDVAPGASTEYQGQILLYTANADTYYGQVIFQTRKRAAPTVITYSPYDGNTGNLYDYSAVANVAVTHSEIGDYGYSVVFTSGAANVVGWHWTAEAEF